MQQPIIKRRKHNGPAPLVAYRRISKDEKKHVVLGLEAQQHAIEAYAKANGLTIAADFWEIIPGGDDDRPEFEQAIRMATDYGYTLVVARLDRLSRRVSVVSRLMEGKPEFIALDAPNGSNFMLHMYAAVAEHERDLISQRTKAALARRREQLAAEGKRLGPPDQRANAASVLMAQATAAEEFRSQIRPRIREMRTAGVTFQQIADIFTREGIPTPSGKGRWSSATAYKALQIPRGLDLVPAYAGTTAGSAQPASNDDQLPLFASLQTAEASV